MPEIDSSSLLSTYGFPFESTHLDIEIYRLISVVAASRTFAEKIAEDESDGQGWKWYKRAELPELSRLLVSIAAISRNNIDSFPGAHSSDRQFIEMPVGVLWPDREEQEVSEPLGFRDACNKILHTDQFNPEVEDASRRQYSALEPWVHLYGRYRGKEWKASLNVFDFAMCAGSLV